MKQALVWIASIVKCRISQTRKGAYAIAPEPRSGNGTLKGFGKRKSRVSNLKAWGNT
jgi:hypothetical protein